MAWIKCNSIEYIPPIPTQTYSVGVSDAAGPDGEGGTHHVGDIPRNYPISVVINTKRVSSFTIHVKVEQGAYASSSYGPGWQSSCDNTTKYTFRVNNITTEGKSLNDYRKNSNSDNNGWVRKEEEWDFSFDDTDLPDGECTIYANVNIDYYQNGDQWDPQAYSYLYFNITNIQYK